MDQFYNFISGSFWLRPHPRQLQLLDCRCSLSHRFAPRGTPGLLSDVNRLHVACRRSRWPCRIYSSPLQWLIARSSHSTTFCETAGVPCCQRKPISPVPVHPPCRRHSVLLSSQEGAYDPHIIAAEEAEHLGAVGTDFRCVHSHPLTSPRVAM